MGESLCKKKTRTTTGRAISDINETAREPGSRGRYAAGVLMSSATLLEPHRDQPIQGLDICRGGALIVVDVSIYYRQAKLSKGVVELE
jgi:hypothetical protein